MQGGRFEPVRIGPEQLLNDPRDWEALRQLLSRKAFFSTHEGQPLRDRNGAVVPWLYHGSEVFLSAEGLRLTGAVLSDRLARFGACQLATYGTSAIPLMAVCLADGEHRGGIVIRKERETYGIARVLEGPVERGVPVVVVDDSLSSGTSLQTAIGALESQGLQVRGALCLVEFSGYGAREWLTGRGYQVETVYDVWRDLGRTGVTAAAEPVHAAPWSDRQVPPGLTPATVARYVAQELLSSGRLLQPPERLAADYDARGGTFVSVRRRSDDVRIARSGVRRDSSVADACLDVVLAAERAAHYARLRTAADLKAVKLAVAFVSAPRPIGTDQIDPTRLALTVRGIGPVARSGFALPHSPHYDDEIQQLRYARTVGRFWRLEPTDLFCHGVQRVVEPGDTWPVYGATPGEADWADSPTLASALGAVVRHTLQSLAGGSAGPLPVCPAPAETVTSLGVSLYRNGLMGCGMSTAADVATALREATTIAWADRRYRRSLRHLPADLPTDMGRDVLSDEAVEGTINMAAHPALGEITAVVTLLIRPRVLGSVAAERLALFYRLGRDTLQASTGARRGLVLAHFAAQQSLDEQAYRQQVLRKADVPAGRNVTWTAFETLGWVVSARGERRLELGYPDRRHPGRTDLRRHSADPGARSAVDLARQIAGFIARHRLDDGLPAYQWSPWSVRATAEGTATRVLIAATALAEAGPVLGEEVSAAAEAIAARFVRSGEVQVPRPGLVWDVAAEAQLIQLLTALEPHEDRRDVVARLARRLRGLVRPDGAIHTGTVRMSADLDLLSGSVLMALARADAWLGDALDGIDVATVLRFSQRRFRLSHPWGMVWWHAQAWAALARRGHEAGGSLAGEATAGGPDPGEPEAGEGIARETVVGGAAVDRQACGDFVLEILDWALSHQSGSSGAFVVQDMEPARVSFLSGCVLEGLADGWAVAQERGDRDRAERYAASWQRGVQFLDRLTLHTEDVYFCPRPADAVGGVRATLPSSELRVDVAGHALRALAKGLRAQASPVPPASPSPAPWPTVQEQSTAR